MSIINKNFKAVTTAPLKSKFLFEERKDYAISVEGYYNLVNPNYIDLWYDVPFYGKVDAEGRLVCPKVELMEYSIGRTNLITFDFLQDALNDYFFFLKKMSAQGRTRLSSLLNEFSIQNSFYDSQGAIKAQTATKLEAYNRLITADDVKIHSFDQYICHLNQTFAESDNNITFFSIFCGNLVPVDASGLAFRFTFEDEDSDILKSKYFKNEEYYKFINISANFGFRVNKNAPWMIVADLNSRPMIGKVGRKIKRYRRDNQPGKRRVETIIPGYLQNKFITNLDSFFEKYYNKVIYESFNMYKESIIQSYTDYVNDYEYLYDHGSIIVGDSRKFNNITTLSFNRTKPKIIPIKSFNSQNMENNYNDYYFIKKFEFMLKHEMNKAYNKKLYKPFKSKFDFMVKARKPINAILDYMEKFYTPTKVYNPETRQLNWRNTSNRLTQAKAYANIQSKAQPSVGKLVTEFLPDI